MTEYRNLLPESIDANAVEEQIYEELQERFSDWEPAEGNLDVWIIRSLSVRISELNETAVDVADEIFVTYGRLRNILRFEPAEAVAESTWTMVDDAGYSIPAGTEVAVARSGNDFVGFQVVDDVTIPQGETTETVSLIAIEPGADANGLSGPVELIDALIFVDSITIDGATELGVDEEPLGDYLNRLRERLEISTETPILPRDFEVVAFTFHPFVGRAVARDGYDPDEETDENERMIALAVTDKEGEPLTSGEREQVQTTLENLREVNFVVHVIDADYTEVDVEFDFEALSGFDPSEVRDEVEAELTRYFSPAVWGERLAGPIAFFGGPSLLSTVRFLEVASTIDRVPGVDYITTLEIGEAGETLGTADIELSGAVPLTRPGTFS
jgi:hypothetical protein